MRRSGSSGPDDGEVLAYDTTRAEHVPTAALVVVVPGCAVNRAT